MAVVIDDPSVLRGGHQGSRKPRLRPNATVCDCGDGSTPGADTKRGRGRSVLLGQSDGCKRRLGIKPVEGSAEPVLRGASDHGGGQPAVCGPEVEPIEDFRGKPAP